VSKKATSTKELATYEELSEETHTDQEQGKAEQGLERSPAVNADQKRGEDVVERSEQARFMLSEEKTQKNAKVKVKPTQKSLRTTKEAFKNTLKPQKEQRSIIEIEHKGNDFFDDYLRAGLSLLILGLIIILVSAILSFGSGAIAGLFYTLGSICILVGLIFLLLHILERI